MRSTLITVLLMVMPSATLAQSPAADARGEVTAAPNDAPQSPADPGPSFLHIFTDLGRDLGRLPAKGSALALGLGGGLAVAVHPADATLSRRASRSQPLDTVFELGDATGSGWTQAGFALGTYVVGRAVHRGGLQAVGADLVQAQMVNAVLTQGVKLSVRRTRPDKGRFSFPSGHTAASFATATVLQRHFGLKLGLPAYLMATYVGASRVQEKRHYASDVIFGAALGVVAGRTVAVGRGKRRVQLSPVAVPGGAGVVVIP